jgi:hypothetical protein
MNAYDTVLCLHLLSLFVLVGAITLVGVSYYKLRAAQSLADAAPWPTLADQTGWAFPLAIVGLVASGAYLTSDAWTWSTSWIDVSLIGLAVVTAQGPLIAGPRAKALKQALDENRPGPLDQRTRRLTRDRALWVVMLANPGVVLGITWNMTTKPGTGEAIAAILAGYALGIAAALPLTNHPRGTVGDTGASS